MEDFVRQVRERRGTILSPLSNINKEIDIKCKKGHLFKMLPTNKEWVWCQECPMPSKGEQMIEKYLRKRNIEFRPEYPVNLPKRQKFYFDFLLKKYRLLVEFDGKQHFEYVEFFKTDLIKQREIDLAKNLWAIKNKYHLLRIPYFEIDNIEEILDSVLAEIGETDCDFLLTPSEDYYEQKT